MRDATHQMKNLKMNSLKNQMLHQDNIRQKLLPPKHQQSDWESQNKHVLNVFLLVVNYKAGQLAHAKDIVRNQLLEFVPPLEIRDRISEIASEHHLGLADCLWVDALIYEEEGNFHMARQRTAQSLFLVERNEISIFQRLPTSLPSGLSFEETIDELRTRICDGKNILK